MSLIHCCCRATACCMHCQNACAGPAGPPGSSAGVAASLGPATTGSTTTAAPVVGSGASTPECAEFPRCSDISDFCESSAVSEFDGTEANVAHLGRVGRPGPASLNTMQRQTWSCGYMTPLVKSQLTHGIRMPQNPNAVPLAGFRSKLARTHEKPKTSIPLDRKCFDWQMHPVRTVSSAAAGPGP